MVQILSNQQLRNMTVNALASHMADCCLASTLTDSLKEQKKFREQAELTLSIIKQRKVEAYV